MAQVSVEEVEEGSVASKEAKTVNMSFKFNAHAKEFVPSCHTQMPAMSDYCYYYQPWFPYSEFPYSGEAGIGQFLPKQGTGAAGLYGSKGFVKDDLKQKIIKQVEYQFSNASLIANDSLMKLINKDPEGFVPISYVAASRKIKPLITGNQMLATTLRGSSKLIVSDDGRKVRRKISLSEKDKEELQSRIVVVENLPEDYSHQNMQKIFSVAGSVKSVRICHPQELNGSKSNIDVLVSNKLHALVEFEAVEQAEKAVEKLNDERNWRKGLRVRLLLRRSPKSVIRNRKPDYDHFEVIFEEDETPRSESVKDSPHSVEHNTESNGEETPTSTGSAKKGLAKAWANSRGRPQSHSGRGILAATHQPTCPVHCEAGNKNSPRGPRMPDGTKGFTLGRGKPMAAPVADFSSSPQQ